MHSSEKRKLADELSAFSTLASCTPDDLLALAEAGDETQLRAAWGIVREGETADACYILLDGTAVVYAGRSPIATLAAGAIIGEMAYSDGGQRHNTVSTQGPARALRIEYPKLTEVLQKHPRLRDALANVYKEHLAASQHADTPGTDG